MQIHNLKYLEEKRKFLRNNLTTAEAVLWKHLQRSQLYEKKFRRQHSITNYILDFYCPAEKLGIELDGSAHDSYAAQVYDDERTKALSNLGVKIIRFTNDEVFDSIESVLEEIKRNFKVPQL